MTTHRDRAAAELPTRHITGPAELVQAVPYLFGFHPRHSLVLIGLDGGHLVVTARVDLDPAGDTVDGPAVELVAGTLARMCDGGATDIVAAVYPDVGCPGDGSGDADGGAAAGLADAVVEAVADAIDQLPCRLREALLVTAGRWWSLLCAPGCCPAEGRPVPATPSPFTAAATLDGVAPLADRDALAATLAPLADRDALAEPLAAARSAPLATSAKQHERSVKRALFAAARASASARWNPPDDDVACRYAVALRAVPIRDSVWLAVDEGRLDGRALWRDLARRVPAPYDAAPLFLFGWASWRAGDGALASMAAERAIGADPGYSAADLLLGALARGIDPRSFPRLRRSA